MEESKKLNSPGSHPEGSQPKGSQPEGSQGLRTQELKTQPAGSQLITLLFDTATETLTIAVFNNSELIFDYQRNFERDHLQNLISEIKDIFQKIELNIKEVKRIVVGTGPGSFTGIRIGIATALTLANSGRMEIAGISTLRVMASALISQNFSGIIFPVIDGRKNRIYTAGYKIRNKTPEKVTEYFDIEPEKFSDFLNSYERNSEILLTGIGLDTYLKEIKNKIEGHIKIAGKIFWYPRISNLLPFYRKLKYVKGEKGKEMKPLYIRKSDAELVTIKPQRH